MAYRGPAFGANTAQQQQKRLSVALGDEELAEGHHSGITTGSHISTTNRSVRSHNLPTGQHHQQHELRRQNTETIGDVINPFTYFGHTKKVEVGQSEEEVAMDEKQSTSGTSTVDGLIEGSVVRLIMHFRHLVGDQDFSFKDEDLEKLRVPLKLSDQEIERMKKFDDTDALIDFLEETKRNYSVKVHKTVRLRKELKEGLDELDDSDSSSDEEAGKKEAKVTKDSGNSTATPPSRKQTLQSIPTEYPHTNRGEKDILIDLNENVYIQVQIFPPREREERVEKRKTIFAIPDPDLSDDTDQESSATWIELFGDVFYVGWLSTFTHSHHIAGVPDIGIYALWFVVMWWTWCSSALYSSRYDRGDVAHHVYKIIELVGLVIMAGGSVDFRTNPRNFIIGYIIMKAVLLLEYSLIFIVSWGAHFHSSRKPFGIYVSVCAISILMWGLSFKYQGAENEASRFVLWYLSILVELLAHIFLTKNSRVSLAASHLGERFGLFTLIILGENCMGFITMASEVQQTPSVIAANSFGVVIIFCYFFMYFDDFSEEFNTTTHLTQLWLYLHFPLHLFQVAFGIAMTDLISIHSMGWDNPVTGGFLKLEACPAEGGESSAAHGAASAHDTTTATTATTGAHDATTAAAHNVTVTEHVTHNLFTAIRAASAAAEGETEAIFCEIKDPNFVIKAFWITGGLILCVNAFIKLINIPRRKASYKSFIICISRIINAVVFFALSAITYSQLNGLAMTAIMMACLLFQSAVDLLD